MPCAPLPVSELAEHLRLAPAFSDDGSQECLADAACGRRLSAIEGRIGKALFERALRADVDGVAMTPDGPMLLAVGAGWWRWTV